MRTAHHVSLNSKHEWNYKAFCNTDKKTPEYSLRQLRNEPEYCLTSSQNKNLNKKQEKIKKSFRPIIASQSIPLRGFRLVFSPPVGQIVNHLPIFPQHYFIKITTNIGYTVEEPHTHPSTTSSSLCLLPTTTTTAFTRRTTGSAFYFANKNDDDDDDEAIVVVEGDDNDTTNTDSTNTDSTDNTERIKEIKKLFNIDEIATIEDTNKAAIEINKIYHYDSLERLDHRTHHTTTETQT